MAVVPSAEAPDENANAISAQITTAKDAKEEILVPIQIWIHVKIIITAVVTIVSIMTQNDKLIFMDYYITSFFTLVVIFYLGPESATRLYTTFYSANKFTRGIQYYFDGFVYILVVSMIFWFYILYIHF